MISCDYGDSCGAALTGSEMVSTGTSKPWEVIANNNIRDGYSKNICLQCSFNSIIFDSTVKII